MKLDQHLESDGFRLDLYMQARDPETASVMNDLSPRQKDDIRQRMRFFLRGITGILLNSRDTKRAERSLQTESQHKEIPKSESDNGGKVDSSH